MRELHVTDGRCFVRLNEGEVRLDRLPRIDLLPSAQNGERRYDPDAGLHILSDGTTQSSAPEGVPWPLGDNLIAQAEALIQALTG